MKIDGVDSFVFTGASPRINKTETTLGLYNEASLVAKQTLYKHLTKDIKENVSIQMSKAYILHEFNEENNLFVVIMCVPCDSVVVSRKEVVHDDTKQSQSEQKHYSNQEETTSVGHIEEIVSTPTISSQLKISPLKIKPIDKDIADGKESVDTKQSKVEKVDEQKKGFYCNTFRETINKHLI